MVIIFGKGMDSENAAGAGAGAMPTLEVMSLTDQSNFCHYRIEGNTLTLIDPDPYWDQFIFNYPIPYDN